MQFYYMTTGYSLHVGPALRSPILAGSEVARFAYQRTCQSDHLLISFGQLQVVFCAVFWIVPTVLIWVCLHHAVYPEVVFYRAALCLASYLTRLLF